MLNLLWSVKQSLPTHFHRRILKPNHLKSFLPMFLVTNNRFLKLAIEFSNCPSTNSNLYIKLMQPSHSLYHSPPILTIKGSEI